jgi:hypothetical protein
MAIEQAQARIKNKKVRLGRVTVVEAEVEIDLMSFVKQLKLCCLQINGLQMLRTGSCKMMQKAGSKTRLRGACSKFKLGRGHVIEWVRGSLPRGGWEQLTKWSTRTVTFSQTLSIHTVRVPNLEIANPKTPSPNKGRFSHLISGLAQQRPAFHSRSGPGSHNNTETLEPPVTLRTMQPKTRPIQRFAQAASKCTVQVC